MPKRFKWHKSKPVKNQPPPNKENAKGDTETHNAQIVVTDGVKIDLVNDLRKQHEAEHEEAAAHNKKQLRWTKIGAFLIFVYASLTAWMAYETYVVAKITNRVFVEANQPHVGVYEVVMRSPASNEPGQDVFMQVKNFGTAPAEQFRAKWGMYINEQPAPHLGEHTDAAIIINPGQSVVFRAHIGPPVLADVLSDNSRLSVEIHVAYKSRIGTPYAECSKFVFAPNTRTFASYGPACTHPYTRDD
jgi:hypothetical protein